MRLPENEVAATKKVSDAISLRKRSSDVAQGCLAIGVDTLGPNDCVERFKGFGGEEYGRSKPLNVLGKVNEKVELRFIKPGGSPRRDSQKILVDFVAQGLLNIEKIDQTNEPRSTFNR